MSTYFWVVFLAAARVDEQVIKFSNNVTKRNAATNGSDGEKKYIERDLFIYIY